MKLGTILGNLIVLTLGVLAYISFPSVFSKGVSHSVPRVTSGMARLPCLANNHCPMGQKCSGGFCSEGFMSSFTGTTDMSSCGAKECNGINAPCSRTSSPCPEGTFCQGNSCVNIAAPNNGTAYNQIGMLLS
jgi:hypothetical protein